MFSSFKSLFTFKTNNSTNKDDNNNYNENNSSDLADQNTAEKTTEFEKEEEEKLRFRLAMDFFKEQDLSKSCYEISLYNQEKMYEKFYTEVLKNWNYSELKDEFRPHYSSTKGGIELLSAETHTLLRSAGYEVIKLIGKKILNGDFNLTTISFPIKMPVYLNLAGEQTDKIERMKLIITTTISCFHNSSVFLKPLNPILGETYETMYDDGSKVNLVFIR